MSAEFVTVASLAEFNAKNPKIIKVQGKQIVLFKSDKGILACNNRCPHEGYPLSEGSMTKDCILTCNWHNWKFDLSSGETLVGGDKLRTYPVQINGDEIQIDISDPPRQQQVDGILENLKSCLDRQEEDQIAREIARLEKAGGDPLDAVRHAIHWTHDHFEYGMTHALAVIPDWLALRETPNLSPADRLVPLVEIVGHLADDSLRQPQFPFTETRTPFDAALFEQAIDQEDEDQAIALLNDALATGIDDPTLFRAIGRAALAHYAGFGHAVIYTYKSRQLIDRLGANIRKPVLQSLIRNLIYARREETLPEFRSYAVTLAAWDSGKPVPQVPLELDGASAKDCLHRVSEHAGRAPEDLYEILLHQLGRNMLYFDTDVMDHWDKAISHNVSWLNYSHGITFANAARTLCLENPALWPQALLQMACFAGRVAGFSDFNQDLHQWTVNDPAKFFAAAQNQLLDHANPEFIVSSHLVKFTTATAEETTRRPNAAFAPPLLAATNRLLGSPFKRKHTRRTAAQSIEFVARE